MKIIKIEESKYNIVYNPRTMYSYGIYRHGEIFTDRIQPNFVNDIIFHLIENLEAGTKLEGFTLCEESYVENIFYKLVNKKSCRAPLRGYYYIDFYDMRLFFRYCYDVDSKGIAKSIPLHCADLNEFNLSEKELLAIANDRTPEMFPLKIVFHKNSETNKYNYFGDNINYYSISNESGYCGAAAIFYNYVSPVNLEWFELKHDIRDNPLAAIASDAETDLYLFPRSVNEWLVISVNEIEEKDVYSILERNNRLLHEEDILSDIVFRYDKESGAVTPVEKK